MGNSISGIFGTRRSGLANSNQICRKRCHDCINNCVDAKRIRVSTSTEYIHKTLFQEGLNSDVNIVAFEKTWRLHKLYLSQSEYFKCMFNGSWLESNQNTITLNELDSYINKEALDAVLASFYSDEIEINDNNVVAILATAKLLQFRRVIVLCNQSMKINLSSNNVMTFMEAAERYTCLDVRKNILDWLRVNLTFVFEENHGMLGNISIELMREILDSDDLVVNSTEFTLYLMLRLWMFIRCQLSNYYDGMIIESYSPEEVNDYYRLHSVQGCFLATADGQPYLDIFRCVRTEYLVQQMIVINSIVADNIIPEIWLRSHMVEQWQYLLTVDNMEEPGPVNVYTDVFNKSSMRCGRFIAERVTFERWFLNHINYGLELEIVYVNDTIIVRRVKINRDRGLASCESVHFFIIKTSIIFLNNRLQPKSNITTNLMTVRLALDEDIDAVKMNSDQKPPFIVSFRILAQDPLNVSIRYEPLPAIENTQPNPEENQ